VLHHHERYDGSGYPHGLKGDEIPLLAQIVGLVDTLEAATSPRSYRRPESLESTLDLLRRGARLGKWRTDLVEHLSAVVYPWTDQ
jgi:putative two-component system response regulator